MVQQLRFHQPQFRSRQRITAAKNVHECNTFCLSQRNENDDQTIVIGNNPSRLNSNLVYFILVQLVTDVVVLVYVDNS